MKKINAIACEIYSHETTVNEIVCLANSLSFATDENDFVREIDQLSILLSRYDPPLSNTLRYIDKKGQDLSTYFVAGYLNTKDVHKGLWIYEMTRLLVRYVLLSDKYYEVRDHRYSLLAKQVHKRIKAELNMAKKRTSALYIL